MKWQDVKKLLIGGGIGIVTLFSALFLLTGVEYEHTGDIVCGETCESYINVTTTYWRICFDNYNGTKYGEETLFKKQTRSRTLHVNLDKIDNIITTEPNVEVDWMVPARGKGNWRPIKGGDCWERRKVNKIKLIGHKEESQTVKWNFDLGDKVNIDPQWIGEEDHPIGYEFINDSVVHIWNTQDDYFFNKSSGVQFTNHYEDYWTRNIFCLGYYNNDEWNKIACADELTNFEKSIESDNETYVNATLWKDISYGIYDLRLGINYYLGLDDQSLSITIYGKNIGIDIPFDLGFAWKIIDWDIPPNETDDKIIVNDTKYFLNGNYDLTFKNMTIVHVNGINGTVDEVIPIATLKGYDNRFLKIDWNEKLDYAVKIYGDGIQESFYVAILVNAGHFNPNQEKSTTFYWVDAGNDGDTVLLLHCDGLDTSTDFPDDSIGGSNHTVTAEDDAQVDTGQTDAFGGNAGVAQLDGTDDILSIPTSADFDFRTYTNSWTVDFWIHVDSIENQGLFWIGGTNDYQVLGLYFGSGKLSMIGSDSGLTWNILENDDDNFPTNEWGHIALVNNAGTLDLYKNGLLVGHKILDANFKLDDGYAVRFGEWYSTGTFLHGFIDEIRISKGVARWDDEFTPPTSPYSALEDTCTCPALNEEWEINMTDYCIIEDNCNLGTGNLNFTGTGNVTCDANINTTNLGDPGSGAILYIKSSCSLLVS